MTALLSLMCCRAEVELPLGCQLPRGSLGSHNGLIRHEGVCCVTTWSPDSLGRRCTASLGVQGWARQVTWTLFQGSFDADYYFMILQQLD